MKFALILVSYCCCCLVAKFCPSFFFFFFFCDTIAARLLCPWDFSRQEYSSGLPFPSSGDLPSQIKLLLMHWQADSLSMSHQGSPVIYLHINYLSVFYIIFQNISREFMLNILRNSCCQIQASASCDSDYYQMWSSKNIFYIYVCVCIHICDFKIKNHNLNFVQPHHAVFS